ncbi:unnamed protein product [Cuscuta epithymum]|uniref:WEB family protein n=1 Tax=Cuscuta epithymum TaxID=186058 RepID=A0AAV0ET47_9ASTE|nr:unnamed protein product [Cuscuta epithymum]
MAEKEECTEMKKKMSPRVEIDTSPPFESVKEAVDRFGGSGPWFPHHLLRMPLPEENTGPLELNKMEEGTNDFERGLIMKEQEALNVLKEVEAAKRYVEGLKLNLMEDEVSASSSSSMSSSPVFSPSERLASFTPIPSPGNVLMELNQAKEDLNKMSMDLSVIRTSVQSLNKEVKNERRLLSENGGRECLEKGVEESMDDIDDEEDWRVNFESEQCKKMADASSYQVMKATLDIARMKESMKMAELRLTAAKKIEEAARALEAIAIAERKALLNAKRFFQVPSAKEMTLLDEKQYPLTPKIEEQCKTKFVDSNAEVIISGKKQLESIQNHKNHPKEALGHLARMKDSKPAMILEEKEPYTPKDKQVPGFKSSVSIGDVLSRKVDEEGDETEKHYVPFSQMLREQSGISLGPGKTGKDGGLQKQYVSQRKKFGFIQVPLANKQNKKRGQ